MTRKGPTAFTEGFGVIVAIGVNQRQPGASEVEGVLEFTARGVVAVMALRVRDGDRGRKATGAGAIKAGEA